MISAIVCVKEDLSFLEECLRSILKNQIGIGEVIVIHTEIHSTILNSYKALFPSINWIPQSGIGLAEARNQGLKETKGELIAFLDSDDIWPAHRTEKMMKVIDSNKSDAVIGALVKFNDQNGAGLHRDINGPYFSLRALTPGGAIIRREAFDLIGNFNNEYSIASDHEWFMRLKNSAIEISYIDQIILYKRIHNQNLSLDTKKYQSEVLKALQRLPKK